MNYRLRMWLLVSSAGTAVACAYPPWVRKTAHAAVALEIEIPAGWAWLFDRPSGRHFIDATTLAVEILVVLATAGFIALIVSDEKKKER